MKSKKGLTLIELLVVMAILGLLSTVAFSQYRTSQQKARDAKRKADLDNIARALEMYYNDNQSYPTASLDGKIMGISWGSEFSKTYGTQTVIYMKELPKDPAANWHYCYESNGSYYKLFAKLENNKDPSYNPSGYSCGGDNTYRYGVRSANVSL